MNQECDRQRDGQTNEQTANVIANASLNHAAWPSILCTPYMSYTYCGDDDDNNDDDDDDDGNDDEDDDDDDDDAGWQTSGTFTAEKLSATLNVSSSIQSTPS